MTGALVTTRAAVPAVRAGLAAADRLDDAGAAQEYADALQEQARRLADADAAADELDAAASPENTRKTYAGCWRRFAGWLVEHGESPALPVAPDLVRAYIGQLAADGRVAKTIAVYISAIRWAHTDAGHRPPSSLELDRTIAASRRALRDREGRGSARPVTLGDLDRILAGISGSLLRDTRNRALVAFLWAGGFRRGEIETLRACDVERTPAGVRVHLRFAKNDQEGRGHTREIATRTDGGPCPVALLDAWLRRASLRRQDPLFPRLTRDGRSLEPRDQAGALRALHGDNAVYRIVRDRAAAVGLAVSPHGLRHGLVQHLRGLGWPAEQVAAYTGQSPATAARYGRRGEVMASEWT